MNHRQAGRENLCNRFGINCNEFLERDLVVYNPATLTIHTNQVMTIPTGYVEIKLPVSGKAVKEQARGRHKGIGRARLSA